jgi:hypothetical protein
MLRVFRTLLFLIATISLLITSLSCHRTPIEPEKIKANLIFEDALCTEAYLRLKLAYIDFPANVDLYVDKNKVNSFRTFSEDTVIMVENLLPKKSYTSYVRIYPAGGGEIVSNEVSFTTMDTTSHNFTWQIDTLGDGGGSVLYDVAIINDTLVYAVGEIYKRDSLGNWDPLPYNLVKWNGQRWQLLRIQFYTFCGQAGTGSYPAKSIFAFGPDDIWIGMNGSQVVRWNGQAQSLPECTPVSINKLWGENPNSIWAVGNNGQIAHYDGVRWRRIESGINVNLLDVYGTPDGAVVWACGYYDDQLGTYLLRFLGSGWEMAYDGTQSEFIIRSDLLSGAFTSVYTDGNKRIYVASPAGVYMAPWNTRGEAKRLSFTPTWFPGFPRRIRGEEARDWFIVGAFNFIAHYNGSTWRHYSELMHDDGRLLSVSQRGNFVVAVGYSYHPIHRRAIVFRGRR